MKRQWQYNPLSHSSASEPIKIAFHTYSHSNVMPRMDSRSKQKSVDKSREKIYTGYQNLNFGQKISLNHYKSPENATLKELPIYEYKENPIKKDVDALTHRIRELDAKLIQYQHRVDSLERTTRNTNKLSSSLEEFMRNQYAELKERERMEERLTTFEQALGHMATIKADRKELENLEVGRYYGLNQRLNQLQRQNGRVDREIQQTNGKLQRVLGKIENNLMNMGQKYEEFIESNIIKTIDHVNQITHHYHTQIEQHHHHLEELTRNHHILTSKLETLQKAAITELPRADKKELTTSLIGISLPGLRLIQSLTIKDDRKVKGLNNFKEHIKQQHKDGIGSSFGAESSSTSTNSQNLWNNMYESLQSHLVNTSIEISFDKVVYKLDRDFNLLDQNDHYLINETGAHIKLNQKHVALLKEQGLIH